MKARTILLGVVAALSFPSFSTGANIDRATFTEVVNSVSVINAGTKRSAPAKTQQLFTAPNVLRTGADSRAELTAEDSTVARIGQNTLFSFEPNSREIELQKGSILFQSPTGKGGGTIRTPAASAAVLGTTLIVTATKNGGFKVLLVEGKGSVKTSTGKFRKLGAGQMVYAMPGGELSNTFEFRLSQQVGASRLVAGFKKPLASAAKIQAAMAKQEKEIAEGKATATNLLATDSPNFAIKIDVARETMIRQAAPPKEVAAVDPFVTDAVIDQSTLEDARLFPSSLDPTQFAAQFFRVSEDDSDSGAIELALNPRYFVGNNVIFDTPTVDLTPFIANDLLRFLAVNDLTFRQSVDLGNFGEGEIQFVAGHTILNQPGTIVSASAGNLAFVALGSTFPLDGTGILTPADFSTTVPLTLADFSVVNRTGSIVVLAGDLNFTDVQLGAHTTLDVGATRDVVMTSSTTPSVVLVDGVVQPSFGAKASALIAGSQVRVAAGRDLDVSRTTIASANTILKSERNLRLTLVNISDGRAALPTFFDSEREDVETGPTSVTMTSRQLADLRGVNFIANDIFIQSNTVRLEGVQFRDGSRVVLQSQIGVLAQNPNTNAPVRPGFVNFVRGVRYGNQPAEEAIVQNGPSSEPSTRGSGIVIRPINGGTVRSPQVLSPR